MIKYVVSMTLTLAAVLPMQAQQENAAFYIYQNDGHFDGFFYDEVEKIRYSKLDTLGVEHEDFVSQEIVTADSTYRIMLSAIDSVGFVQPEIKINPKLRNMREEGMLTYLRAKDDDALTLTFSDAMPSGLRPVVEDVLVDFDIYEGFGGKVRSVTQSGDNIVVQCDPLEGAHDIFQQFISVEQYDQDRGGNLIRRRVAGMPEMSYDARRYMSSRKTDSFDLDLLNFTVSGHWFLLQDTITKNSISFDIDAEIAVSVKASWNFPWVGDDRVSVTTTLNASVGVGMTVNHKFRDVFTVGLNELGQLPIPAAAPIFVLNFGPDGFVRGDINAKFNVQSPKLKGKVWARMDILNWKPLPMDWGFGKAPIQPGEDEEDEGDNKIEASLEVNGFVQGGMKFDFAFGVNKLLSKIVKLEIKSNTYLGPKLSGALSVDLRNMYDNGRKDMYGNLKNTKASLSLFNADYECLGTYKMPLGDEQEVPLADGSFSLAGTVDCYLFPEFTDWRYRKEPVGPYGMDVNCISVKPTRYIFWPQTVGISVYPVMADGETPAPSRTEWEKESYWQFFSKWRSTNNRIYMYFGADKSPLSPGEYVFRPVIRTLGMEIPCGKYEFTAPGAYMTGPYHNRVDLPASEDSTTISIPIKSKDVKTDLITLNNYQGEGSMYALKNVTASQIDVDVMPKGGVLTWTPGTYGGNAIWVSAYTDSIGGTLAGAFSYWVFRKANCKATKVQSGICTPVNEYRNLPLDSAVASISYIDIRPEGTIATVKVEYALKDSTLYSALEASLEFTVDMENDSIISGIYTVMTEGRHKVDERDNGYDLYFYEGREPDKSYEKRTVELTFGGGSGGAGVTSDSFSPYVRSVYETVEWKTEWIHWDEEKGEDVIDEQRSGTDVYDGANYAPQFGLKLSWD